MPMLGMSQDSGRLLGWRKAVGERVAPGEAVMEIETDKAVVEIEADVAGYLTEQRVAEGADVPIGTVVAIIDDHPPATATGPGPTAAAALVPAATGATPAPAATGAAPVPEATTAPAAPPSCPSPDRPPSDHLAPDRPSSAGPAPGPSGPARPPSAPAPQAAGPAPTAAEPAAAVAPVAPTGTAPAGEPARILASPLARRVAAAEGLALERLVRLGHPQPYHLRDLERLRALPAEARPAGADPAGALPAAAPLRLRLAVRDGVGPFCDWAASEGTALARPRLWAALAAAAVRAHRGGAGQAALTVRVQEGAGPPALLADPDRQPLGAAATAPAGAPAPAVLIRDLAAGPVRELALPRLSAPVTLHLHGDRAGPDGEIDLALDPDLWEVEAALALASALAALWADPRRLLL